jgi:hypothetical protein
MGGGCPGETEKKEKNRQDRPENAASSLSRFWRDTPDFCCRLLSKTGSKLCYRAIHLISGPLFKFDDESFRSRL